MATVDTSGQTTTPQRIKGEYDLSDLKEKYRKAKSMRERFLPDWTLNLAFYVGQQWVYWARTGNLSLPTVPDWMELVTDNRIMPTITSRVAKKVKDRPQFVITPSTADEADIDAAKIGEKVLDVDWISLDLQRKLFATQLFTDICGAGFWKVYWDSTLGDSVEVLLGPDGQPQMAQNGSPIKAEQAAAALGGQLPDGYSTQAIAKGDICVDVISPFELFPDPLATTLEDCEWMVEEKVRSPEYILKRYGVKLDPDTDAPMGPVEARLFSSTVYSSGATGVYQGVKVFECWQRPCTDYPNGHRCVWAQDQVLEADDQPYDPMPYIMFSGIRVPNRFWPSSITTQLRGPQVNLNKFESQIAMNAARIGNPALMKSRQANVQYTGAVGEEILYDSTVPDAIPSYLQPPEVPGYVREHIERILESFVEISGMHEVSNATVPAGVTAASAINLLQEADDTRIGPEIQDMEVQLGNAGTKVLKLRAQYNDDERLLSIAGEDGNWDIFGFRGQMLRGNTQAEVQAGSAMPHSKAAKQAAMLEVLQIAFQYGLNFDPRDLRNFFKAYDVGALERLFDSMTNDEMQVQREQRLMSQGIAVNINDYDDDQYHLDAHQDFQKTDRYAQLGPNIKQLVQMHVDAHRQRMVDVVNQQVQQQQASQQGIAPQNGYPATPAAQISTPEGGLADVALP